MSLESRDPLDFLVSVDPLDQLDPLDCLVLPERLVVRYEISIWCLLTPNQNMALVTVSHVEPHAL